MVSGPIAYLFAGQGSQYIGMGRDLYESFPASKTIFEQADRILGFLLSQLCFAGAEDALRETAVSQPAVFTASLAAYAAFRTKVQEKAVFMAGLSLGEYSALVAAGALSFEQGLLLVRRRAQLMQEAAVRYPGKMSAVLDLELDKLKNICLLSGAEIANINAPGQVVISGRKEAVLKATELCLKEGAKRVIELEVSGGFHSSLMFAASSELRQILADADFSQPAVPVVSNYTARPQYRMEQLQENLVYQLYSPVRWEESMRFILSQGVLKFYEFGPGRVLKGLLRRIQPAAEVVAIEKRQDIEALTQDGPK
jgi:[acyl-carrier-protein] S-malonyltransferase